jgi:hypothetical protein
MEYRGKYYIVFRSPTAIMWTWSVDLDPQTVESGKAASQEAAMQAAEDLIDKSFLPKKRKLAGVVLKFRDRLP